MNLDLTSGDDDYYYTHVYYYHTSPPYRDLAENFMAGIKLCAPHIRTKQSVCVCM